MQEYKITYPGNASITPGYDKAQWNKRVCFIREWLIIKTNKASYNKSQDVAHTIIHKTMMNVLNMDMNYSTSNGFIKFVKVG